MQRVQLEDTLRDPSPSTGPSSVVWEEGHPNNSLLSSLCLPAFWTLWQGCDVINNPLMTSRPCGVESLPLSEFWGVYRTSLHTDHTHRTWRWGSGVPLACHQLSLLLLRCYCRPPLSKKGYMRTCSWIIRSKIKTQWRLSLFHIFMYVQPSSWFLADAHS